MIDYSLTCDCGQQGFGFGTKKEAERSAKMHLWFRASGKCVTVYIDKSRDKELTGESWRVVRFPASNIITIAKR